MFGRLGRIVVHNPWKVIAVWLVLLVGAFFAPPLEVNTDQADFLPDSYESVQAQQLAETAFGQASNAATATIVVRRDDGQPLSDADVAKIGDAARRLNDAGIDKVTGAVTGPQMVSPNKVVQLVTVTFEGLPDDPALVDSLREVRSQTGDALGGSGLDHAVTGDVALIVDNQDAFNDALV